MSLFCTHTSFGCTQNSRFRILTFQSCYSEIWIHSESSVCLFFISLSFFRLVSENCALVCVGFFSFFFYSLCWALYEGFQSGNPHLSNSEKCTVLFLYYYSYNFFPLFGLFSFSVIARMCHLLNESHTFQSFPCFPLLTFLFYFLRDFFTLSFNPSSGFQQILTESVLCNPELF